MCQPQLKTKEFQVPSRHGISSRGQPSMGFPSCSDGKESTCNAGDTSSIPGLGRSPGGGHSNPLQYSGLENPHGERSLASYSPWGCKELDMTNQLSMHTHNKHP